MSKCEVILTDDEIVNSVESVLKEHRKGLDYIEEREDEGEFELTNAKHKSRARIKHRKGLDYLRDK